MAPSAKPELEESFALLIILVMMLARDHCARPGRTYRECAELAVNVKACFTNWSHKASKPPDVPCAILLARA